MKLISWWHHSKKAQRESLSLFFAVAPFRFYVRASPAALCADAFGTKAVRSQLCIISSVRTPSALTLYHIRCNTQVLNPYYTLSGII